MDKITKLTLLVQSAGNNVKDMIDMALRNPTLLTVKEFIEETKLDIDTFMVDRFWSNLENDVPIYVDKVLIDWCGYKGEDKKKKEKLLKFLQSAGVDYFELTNDEYKKVMSPLEGPQSKDINWPTEIKTGKGYGRATHILITPRNFKKLVMRLNTARGDQIREYFVSLEDLFKMYCEYQVKYRELQVRFRDTKIDNLMNEMKLQTEKIDQQSAEIKELLGETYAQSDQLNRMEASLEIAVEQRVPPTASAGAREHFVLYRLAQNDTNRGGFHFYVVRSQRNGLATACRRVTLRYTNAIKVLEIIYQPNSRNLFSRIKERTTGRATFIYNSVRLDTMTPDEFIALIYEVDGERSEL